MQIIRNPEGKADNKAYAVNEVIAGIKQYLNTMLGTQLFYKFERQQYTEIIGDHPGTPCPRSMERHIYWDYLYTME